MFSWNAPKGDDAILTSTANLYFPTFIYKCSDNFNMSKLLDKFYIYNNHLWHFCVKYKNFESEIRRNYNVLRIFSVSFVESFQKFRRNFIEISYKIYENLRSIEKILKKFVRNIGLIIVQLIKFLTY